MEEDIKYLKSQEAYEMYFRGNPRLEKIVNGFIERIKELEEETDLLIGQNEWYKDYYDCESIPTSLIKEKIEELNDMIIEIHRGNLQRYTVSEILSFIRFCEELLNTKM